ncbi:hypothetical protein AB0F36_27020 [Streptomyces sp. NPDC029080]|uniref:hypothetical protein n=1 Tax=Streptomyces sp. NPDC029080 TaxID=3155017 RepID=UPI0033ECFCB5
MKAAVYEGPRTVTVKDAAARALRRLQRAALGEAPTAYEHFDARDEGWIKVVLHPDGHGNGHKQ